MSDGAHDRVGHLSPARFRALLDAYGAAPERWPAADRAAALALLAESPEAREQQAHAARLDALLDMVAAPEPSAELRARVLAQSPAVRPQLRRAPARRWLAVGGLTAAAAALLLWMLPRGAARHASVPLPIAVSYEGDYTMPSDVLLTPPGPDVSHTEPSVGCTAAGLGCTLSDDEPARQSQGNTTRRVA
jgi:hypothetical protein